MQVKKNNFQLNISVAKMCAPYAKNIFNESSRELQILKFFSNHKKTLCLQKPGIKSKTWKIFMKTH